MDKKPLIVVSILAVVLLVLGSLSNVVGYQSVKSTTVKDSPLFQTRTQRANNQQQNYLTSKYLGIGKENLLQFPARDNLVESLKNGIEYIYEMDEETVARFTQLCIQRIHQNPLFNNIDDEEIKLVLELIREGPTPVILYAQNHTLNMPTTDICPLTYDCNIPSLDIWLPGCLIMGVILWIFMRISEFFHYLPGIIRFIISIVIQMINIWIAEIFTIAPVYTCKCSLI
jgi:hypothetical protein